MQNRNQATNNNNENTNPGTAPSGDSPVIPSASELPLNGDSHTALNDSPQLGTEGNPQAALNNQLSEVNTLTASLAANNGSVRVEIRSLQTNPQELPRQGFNRGTLEHRTSEELRVVLTDPLVADAVNGPSTRSNIESRTEVTTPSDLFEPLHFNPNSELENLSIDGAELIPGLDTDMTTAYSDLPFPVRVVYFTSSCWAVVKVLSYIDQMWIPHSVMALLAMRLPHELSLAAINGYAIYHYKTVSEPINLGLRALILAFCTIGILDGIYQVMNFSSWGMYYAITCVIIEGLIATYHSCALVYQTIWGNANFPASNYEFLKRSFILQAEFLICEMSGSKKEFTAQECRIMEHSAKCDLAKINTVFGRTITRDACMTIIGCYDRYQEVIKFKDQHFLTFDTGPEQLQMLIVPTQKALDYLVDPRNSYSGIRKRIN